MPDGSFPETTPLPEPNLSAIARADSGDSAIAQAMMVGVSSGRMAEAVVTHGFDYALSLTVPPLGFVLLKRV